MSRFLSGSPTDLHAAKARGHFLFSFYPIFQQQVLGFFVCLFFVFLFFFSVSGTLLGFHTLGVPFFSSHLFGFVCSLFFAKPINCDVSEGEVLYLHSVAR